MASDPVRPRSRPPGPSMATRSTRAARSWDLARAEARKAARSVPQPTRRRPTMTAEQEHDRQAQLGQGLVADEGPADRVGQQPRLATTANRAVSAPMTTETTR